MSVEGAHSEVETEIGVRYTGTGDEPWVERWLDKQSAQNRYEMYRRKGDKNAALMKRTVTTTWTAWRQVESLPSDFEDRP